MDLGGQEETARFLLEKTGALETIETHISLVALARERAYKLKRRVKFPYLDFTTPETRLAMCEREVELNRRTAPKLYLGVRRITREADGSLQFDGDGALVDAVVEMRRFDGNALLDRLAERRELTAPLIERLARRVAAFHAAAPADRERGGFSGMMAVIELDEAAAKEAKLAPAEEIEAFSASLRAQALRHQPRLDARRDLGKVRRCHGDLTLRNICVEDGEPLPFDCIEFSDDLATIDVLHDLAFLLMDLWRTGENGLANLALNRYLDHCDEADGLALLPFFMAMRAFVRAHVAAARGAALEARSYLDLARSLLSPAKRTLVALGGYSGSGKSSVAARLAPLLGSPPGARVLNSDRLRKALFKAQPTARLPEDAYAPGVSRRVYGIMRGEAARVLANEWSVIVDAVLDRSEDRQAIEAIARNDGVSFAGFWLEAAAEVCCERVAARRDDVSDATVEVVMQQRAKDPGEMSWTRIDAARKADEIAADIGARL